jgi:TRAP transporter 4TM/12TM fusion protein
MLVKASEVEKIVDSVETNKRELTGPLNILCIVLTIVGIIASILYIFSIPVMGKVMWPRSYQTLLIGCFLTIVILRYSHNPGVVRVRWFDLAMAGLCLVTSLFIFISADSIEYKGWGSIAPMVPVILAFLYLIVMLEGTRRVAGSGLFFVSLFFFFFPLFSQYLFGFMRGVPFTLRESISNLIFGTEAVFGLVMTVMGNILMGYLIFAVVLQATGGGAFFINLAYALMGKSRGGPAKVAVLASGLFGSINGACTVNVATTGAFTIPSMKKLGYDATFAGAVEACASLAGTFMPPVMGATAFLIVQVIGVSYVEVITAAFVPATLYYLSLMLQIDLYAAKANLKGMPAEEIPTLKTTLLEGWPFLFSLVALVLLLLVYRLTALAPFYTSALLLLTVSIRKSTRLTWRDWYNLLISAGNTMSSIIASLLGVGIIIGSLTMTGVAYSFSHEILKIAGGNAVLLLVLGAGVSMVLGMGMTISACYIFLAMTMAPPLVAMGFDPLAIHLFVMYYGMLSGITPPVAITAYTAASISGASPVKTGFKALSLGAMLFVLPFTFVFEPALILRGDISVFIRAVLALVIGIFLLNCGKEGFIHWFGNLGKIYSPKRLFIIAIGLLLVIPKEETNYIGFIGAAILLGMLVVYKKRQSASAGVGS